MKNIVPSKCFTVFHGHYAAADNTAAGNDFRIDVLEDKNWIGLVTLQLVAEAADTGTSTLDVVIKASLDAGTTYNTLLSFTQITGGSAGNEIKQITIPAGALLKTDINLGSATTYPVTLYAQGAIHGGSGN
jgi:hypothetical protein